MAGFARRRDQLRSTALRALRTCYRSNGRKGGHVLIVLQVISVILGAITMALSLAHALEMPGKRRLGRETYLVVQQIYYPGFTIGGISEILVLIAVIALWVVMPTASAESPWALGSFLAFLANHIAYWALTHPVNRFWADGRVTSAAGKRFFGLGTTGEAAKADATKENWIALGDRWERSHLVRALLSMTGLALLVTGIAL